MADTKKEQERSELHRTIWGIADDLRGSVDGWDFKQYILGMLFYRYISENLATYINMTKSRLETKTLIMPNLIMRKLSRHGKTWLRPRDFLFFRASCFKM